MKRLIVIVSAMMLASLQAPAVTVTLQQGVNGYGGAKDIEIRDPNHNYNSGVFPVTTNQFMSVIESNW